MRLDQSNWVTIYDKLLIKSDPWERFPVPLPITDRALIAVNRTTQALNRHRAAWVSQEWLRGSTPALVFKKQIGFNQLTLLRLEPVTNSFLWVELYEWVTDFNLRVEIREYDLETNEGIELEINFDG